MVSDVDSDSAEMETSVAELLQQSAACDVLYLGSADTEALSGPEVRCFYIVFVKLLFIIAIILALSCLYNIVILHFYLFLEKSKSHV